jgi:rSAM/selenodomain-associated transferase 1
LSSNETVNLAVFLKQPRPGRVKTRLETRLSAEDAADLYTAFLWDTVTLVARSSARRLLFFHEGPPPSTFLPAYVWRPAQERALEIPQRGGDLGERLAGAVDDAATGGNLPLLILGSDSPDLPLPALETALAALATHDLVLGPAHDGGVWCIGLARPVPSCFEGVPWSSSRTGRILGNRARTLGLNLAEVETWYDVDEIEDVERLRTRLLEGKSKAKWTEQWLVEHTRRREPGAESSSWRP